MTYDLLADAYGCLLDAFDQIDETNGWLPTRCNGWAIRDLIFHLLADAQRGLVALHTDADVPPDIDA